MVFDWSAAPPPPPPVVSGAFRDLVASDPEGVELVREKMLEFWPKLGFVATQSIGANVGRDQSEDGLGYGPVFTIDRYRMSTAFLATEEFRDKDSLSARIVQARFSGHFRFACRAFKEFMANPAMAAAGHILETRN